MILESQTRADLAACRESLRHGSRSFLAASLLLPRAVREPACALYAFCRLADDEIDGQTGGHGGDPARLAAAVDGGGSHALDRLRHRLARVYAGAPWPHAADRALAAVVKRYGIPRVIPEALLEGFEWDASGRRYETLEQLHHYAARVAGTVGAMMALLMGVRSEAGLARACDLGVAMQLSNIARDIGEDARMGRVYLPLAWLREAGIDPDEWLKRPLQSAALAGVVQRLLDHADVLYRRVGAGVAELPLACRPGINAARFLYAAIGDEVARRRLDAVNGRAVVPRWRKVLLLAAAMTTLAPARVSPSAPPLPANRFLVLAAANAAIVDAGVALPAWWRLDRRWVQVIELFERLERRKRSGALVR